MEFNWYLSPNVMHYERQVYTSLDFLGDIGGLFDALCAICKIILALIAYLMRSGPQSFIIKRLFKRERESRSSDFETDSIKKHMEVLG